MSIERAQRQIVGARVFWLALIGAWLLFVGAMWYFGPRLALSEFSARWWRSAGLFGVRSLAIRQPMARALIDDGWIPAGTSISEVTRLLGDESTSTLISGEHAMTYCLGRVAGSRNYEWLYVFVDDERKVTKLALTQF